MGILIETFSQDKLCGPWASCFNSDTYTMHDASNANFFLDIE